MQGIFKNKKKYKNKNIKYFRRDEYHGNKNIGMHVGRNLSAMLKNDKNNTVVCYLEPLEDQ